MDYAVSIHTLLHKFMQTLSMSLSSAKETKWCRIDQEFHQELLKLQDVVDAALRDNFDTARVIREMHTFTHVVHKYLSGTPKHNLILSVQDYYNKMFNIFGLHFKNNTAVNGDSSKIIDLLVKYRYDIRAATQRRDWQQIYQLSDDIRDRLLPELGVMLTDKLDCGQWCFI